jgi:hypothetical protein
MGTSRYANRYISGSRPLRSSTVRNWNGVLTSRLLFRKAGICAAGGGVPYSGGTERNNCIADLVGL